MSVMLQTPDAANLDLCTAEGSRKVFAKNPRFMSMNLRSITDEQLQVQTRILSLRVFGCMAHALSKAELALIVPRGEKLALAAVAEEALRKEQGSKQWKREGRLSEIGQEAMDTLTPWAKDIDFVEALLSDGGVMSVIVGLCDATDLRSCPDQQFTETLISISRNCSLSLRVKAQENDDSSPLLPLVKSGALAKVIKFGCVGHPEMAKEADEILDMVRLDLRLVRKHFKRGGELYEALTAAVNSQKSRQYPKLRETMNHLLGTHLMQTHTVSPGHMCRTCSAEEQPGIKMLACAKCRSAFYCSKECQRADWKDHKPLCGGNLNTDRKSVTSMINSFFAFHYDSIRMKMALKAQLVRAESGGDKPLPRMTDLVILAQSHRLLEGAFEVGYVPDLMMRRNLPDWVYPRTNKRVMDSDTNVTSLLMALGDQHKRLLPSQVLLALNFPDNVGVYRFNAVSPTGGPSISDENIGGRAILDMLTERFEANGGF